MCGFVPFVFSASLNHREVFPFMADDYEVARETWGGITVCGHRMAYRKWKETNVQPGTAGPGNMLGCSLVSFHFLWAILCPQAVGSLIAHLFDNTYVKQFLTS